jgi:hypothetical protein
MQDELTNMRKKVKGPRNPRKLQTITPPGDTPIDSKTIPAQVTNTTPLDESNGALTTERVDVAPNNTK